MLTTVHSNSKATINTQVIGDYEHLWTMVRFVNEPVRGVSAFSTTYTSGTFWGPRRFKWPVPNGMTRTELRSVNMGILRTIIEFETCEWKCNSSRLTLVIMSLISIWKMCRSTAPFKIWTLSTLMLYFLGTSVYSCAKPTLKMMTNRNRPADLLFCQCFNSSRVSCGRKRIDK